MFCPVCNGIQSLHGSCSFCGGTVMDGGRMSDYAGPYAPYEQIEFEQRQDDANMQNNHVCKHLLYCSTCEQITEAAVKEWD
ncbi:hypothetical protein L1N85_18075 [Paenibacillus alkaliterrae]|uniref:hypothetical protein n=1 Tax=Paenibacillus alkaliterrae TaxID=320909 RepID=UPI001F28CBD3|nr:hypothetical protein [Paenibacillus alkaliterrae]MCF2940315.1 hypothetical protein [Paenibacillus alkaliterrae]